MREKKTFIYDFIAAFITAAVIELMLRLPVHSILALFRTPAEAAAELWAGLKTLSFPRVCIFWGGGLFLFRLIRDPGECFVKLFEYRWQIGLGVILGATVLKLNGSSIGCLAEVFEGDPGSSLLLGKNRIIRSDEFVAFTEMALAQTRSGFQWFSDIWGYSPTDMFIVYGQPVSDPVTLFRPFSAGYLLLGAEYGLAFYWSARFVFLYLVSFEFGRMLTGDRRDLAALYGVLVALSPLVQWWYSVNELAEIIIFGQAAILLTRQYICSDHLSEKILLMAGLVICAGGYVMTLYPAWAIPFFYVFAACFICMLWENRRSLRPRKADAAVWCCGILIFGLAMGYIFTISGDTVIAQLNTVYPGARTYTGGPVKSILLLFRGWTSWLWTLFEIGNPCEEVCFISFFPLGILLALLVQKEERRADCWFLACGMVELLLVIYMCFPLPTFIGKITLLSHTSPRMAGAAGFVNLIILFRALALRKKDRNRAVLGLLVGAVIAVAALKCIDRYEVPYGLRMLLVLVCVAGTEILLHFSGTELRKELTVLVLLLSVLGGLAVNPINRGLGMIYNTSVVKKIEQLEREESGSWFVNGSFIAENLPTIVGAKSINALATYPDTQLWRELGLEEKSDIWNRYAHNDGRVSEENDVVLLGPDHLEMHVTVEKLRELGVRYILSQGSLEKKEFEELFAHNGWYIYSISPAGNA